MKEHFRQYILDLYKDVPSEIYEGLLAVFCLGAVVMMAFWGIKRGLWYSAGLLLVEYVFLLFCSTVFFRAYSETRGHNFRPFWSYERQDLLIENIMNVAVFVPIGVLLSVTISRWKMFDGSRKRGWLVALTVAVGLIISGSIETLQYFFKRGFAEVDDVIHNTLGCLIGLGLAYIILKLIKMRSYCYGSE